MTDIATKTIVETARIAANDDAPRAKTKLGMRDIVGTIEFDAVEASTDANGKGYATLKAMVTGADGKAVERTVVAAESYDLVKQVVYAHQPLVATMRRDGAALKIVGVLVGGTMRMIDAPLAKAA